MGAPVRLAIERHQVDDPGERAHTASAGCWCQPVVEVVHRRQEPECIAVYRDMVCGLAERHHRPASTDPGHRLGNGPHGVAGHPFIAPRSSVQALRDAFTAYGHHAADCEYALTVCTCGFTEAMRSLFEDVAT